MDGWMDRGLICSFRCQNCERGARDLERIGSRSGTRALTKQASNTRLCKTAVDLAGGAGSINVVRLEIWQ